MSYNTWVKRHGLHYRTQMRPSSLVRAEVDLPKLLLSGWRFALKRFILFSFFFSIDIFLQLSKRQCAAGLSPLSNLGMPVGVGGHKVRRAFASTQALDPPHILR